MGNYKKQEIGRSIFFSKYGLTRMEFFLETKQPENTRARTQESPDSSHTWVEQWCEDNGIFSCCILDPTMSQIPTGCTP